MPTTVAITMSGTGYLVTAGTRTVSFQHVNDAVEFARHHLRLAEQLRSEPGQLN
jgi:hypothetical protein